MKKIYLENLSPEEVTKKINNGEIVYNNDIDGVYYKMINRIICRFDNDKITHFGYEFPNNDSYYFEEEKELIKFEVGKHYKTKANTEVVCFRIHIDSNDDGFPIRLIELNSGKLMSVDKDGKFYGPDSNSSYDIVGYWKE